MTCDLCGKKIRPPSAWIIVRASVETSRMGEFCAACIRQLMTSTEMARFERASRHVDVGTNSVKIDGGAELYYLG